MYGPDNSTAVATRPTRAAAGPANLWFTPGNPAAGQQATSLDPDFMNGVLAELESILSAAGVSLDKTKDDQLLTAIKALAYKWLGGGAYRGVNYIANSRTLDASYCGYLNVLINVPVEKLPLANSVASGTPIDFACQTGGALIQTQGSDQIFLLEAGVSQYVCGTSSKVKFVSDGGSTWNVAQESNLFAPAFRDHPTAPTPARSDSSGVLQTTAGALALGRRFAGHVPLTGAATLNASHAGKAISLGGGAGYAVGMPSASDPGLVVDDCITIFDTAGLAHTINAAAGQSLLVPSLGTVSSYVLPPYGSIEFYTTGGGWSASQSSSAFQLVQTVDPANQTQITFSWNPSERRRVRLEFINLNGTIGYPGQNGGTSGATVAYVANGTATTLFTFDFGSGSQSGESGGPGIAYASGFAELNNLDLGLPEYRTGLSPYAQGASRPATPVMHDAGGGLLDGSSPVVGLRLSANLSSGQPTHLLTGSVKFYAGR